MVAPPPCQAKILAALKSPGQSGPRDADQHTLRRREPAFRIARAVAALGFCLLPLLDLSISVSDTAAVSYAMLALPLVIGFALPRLATALTRSIAVVLAFAALSIDNHRVGLLASQFPEALVSAKDFALLVTLAFAADLVLLPPLRARRVGVRTPFPVEIRILAPPEGTGLFFPEATWFRGIALVVLGTAALSDFILAGAESRYSLRQLAVSIMMVSSYLAFVDLTLRAGRAARERKLPAAEGELRMPVSPVEHTKTATSRPSSIPLARGAAALGFCTLPVLEILTKNTDPPSGFSYTLLVMPLFLGLLLPRLATVLTRSIATGLAVAAIVVDGEKLGLFSSLFPETLATTTYLALFAVLAVAADLALAVPPREERVRLRIYPIVDIHLVFPSEGTRSRLPILGLFRFSVLAVAVTAAVSSFALAAGEEGWTLLQFTASVVTLCMYLAVVDLMVQAGRAGRQRKVRRRWLRWLTAAVVIFPCCTAFASREATTDWKDIPVTRMTAAASLFQDLLHEYPHWDTAPIEPRQLWKKYWPALVKADAVCGGGADPCFPYVVALQNMLGELQNGHTLLVFPDGIGAPALRLEKIEGQAVVIEVRDVSESEAMGLSWGTVVLAVDGIPVREALARAPAWLVAAASPRAREYESYRHLLYGRGGTTVRVLFQNEGGAPFLVELEREVIDIGYDDDSDEGEEDPNADEIYLPSEMTDDGIGYVRLFGFDGKPLVERFDKVMDELQDAKGIILDLRENRGGYLEAGLDVVGRFLPEAETIGKSCEAVRHADGRREEVCHVQIALPQQHVYRGPLAVLINQRTFSAGEIVAHALCDSGRARCFGARTAGETDCARRQLLPGAILQRSVCDFRTESGQSLLGIGVTPHVEIEKTLDDVRSFRNPVREAAEAWLRSPEEKPGKTSEQPRTNIVPALNPR